MTVYAFFGGSNADVTADASGNVLGGIHLRAYTAQTGGVQITDTKDAAGTATAGDIVSNATAGVDLGRILFQAPNTFSLVWMDRGSGARWPIVSQTLLGQIAAAIANSASATAAAASAVAAAATATAAANTATGEATSAFSLASEAISLAEQSAQGKSATVDGLTYPVFIAHRGGAAVSPENTLDAYRVAMAMPNTQVLEGDFYLTRDGGLYQMHDATLDRTTSLTGNSVDFLMNSIVAGRVDAGVWFNPSWASTLRIPTAEEIADEFGGRAVWMPEAKNTGAGAALTAVIVEHGLQNSTIVQSFFPAELIAPNAAGIATLLLVSDLSGAGDYSAWAGLYDWIGVQSTVGVGSWIATAHAQGLKVGIWTVDRRSDSDAWIAGGADGIFSNDPWYIGRAIPPMSTDGFNNLTWPSGMLAEAVSSIDSKGRGQWVGANWGYVGLTTGVRPATSAFCLMGHMCPIKGSNNPTAYTITVGVSPKVVTTTSWWASVFLGFSDDKIFDDTDIVTGGGTQSYTGVNGYHILFRMTGGIDIYKVTNGVANLLGSQTGTLTALTATTNATYKITVTATTIKAERTDIVGATNTQTDSTYRGGYFGLGNFHTDPQFRSVVVA